MNSPSGYMLVYTKSCIDDMLLLTQLPAIHSTVGKNQKSSIYCMAQQFHQSVINLQTTNLSQTESLSAVAYSFQYWVVRIRKIFTMRGFDVNYLVTLTLTNCSDACGEYRNGIWKSANRNCPYGMSKVNRSDPSAGITRHMGDLHTHAQRRELFQIEEDKEEDDLSSVKCFTYRGNTQVLKSLSRPMCVDEN